MNEIRRFEPFHRWPLRHVPAERSRSDHRAPLTDSRSADDARKAGASVELGRRFHSLHPNGRGLILEVERCSDGSREEARAGTIVGSDGAASRVAKAAGWQPLETVPLMQAIVPLPKDMPHDTARVWFVPAGHLPISIGSFRKTTKSARSGIIGENGPEMRKAFDNFLAKRNSSPSNSRARAFPSTSAGFLCTARIGNGSVYLVGDAAAQVKVSTVGGTVTGFRGALGVAEAILNGGVSRELKTLRRELDLHLMLRRSMHDFQQADYSQLVDLLNDPARHSLSLYSRDEAWKILWRVCLQQPRLIWLGLRGPARAQ